MGIYIASCPGLLQIVKPEYKASQPDIITKQNTLHVHRKLMVLMP